MVKKVSKVLGEFKKFLLRGNVVDLAVAVVIGASFGAVVQAMVKDLITPLIAAIGGQPDFSKLSFTIHNSTFLYGDFLNALISFIILATVIFFFVITPVNHLVNRFSRKPDPTTKKCPYCQADLPAKAIKCQLCTSDLDAA